MNSDDRELLSQAACAAGLDMRWIEECGDFYEHRPHMLPGYWDKWNPLQDDGDALRLAADLHMDVYVRAEWVEAVAPMGAPQKVRYGLEGPRVAARTAITRAAAAMPPRRVFGAA